ACNGGPHKDGLVHQWDNFQLLRNVGENPGKRGLHRVDDGQRGRLPVPGDGNQNAAGSVGADYIVLDLKAVVDLRYVLHVDGCAVDRFDGQVVQLLEDRWAAG